MASQPVFLVDYSMFSECKSASWLAGSSFFDQLSAMRIMLRIVSTRYILITFFQLM